MTTRDGADAVSRRLPRRDFIVVGAAALVGACAACRGADVASEADDPMTSPPTPPRPTTSTIPPGVARPDDAWFSRLPDHPWVARYVDVGGVRMHYVDEGPPEAAPVLLVHGFPTWSYTYRKMVPPLLAAGHRVVVPDLIGFGRSDKYESESAYTYDAHTRWLARFVEHLSPLRATLVAHDFGGMVALRVLAEREGEGFSRLVLFDTSLNDGTDGYHPLYLEGFAAWKRLWRETPGLSPGTIISSRCERPLAPEVVAAYDAPYPSEAHRAALRVNESLYPLTTADPGAQENHRARRFLESWSAPVAIIASGDAELTHPGHRAMFRSLVGPDRLWRDVLIEGSRHFFQEDRSPELARHVAEFVAAT